MGDLRSSMSTGGQLPEDFEALLDWPSVLERASAASSEDGQTSSSTRPSVDLGVLDPTPAKKGSSSSPSTRDKLRKHACSHPGCDKSFTTSGHLARHVRIHTGERHFQCTFPGCESRFSRHDNMLQHYRSHICRNSRRKKTVGGPNEPVASTSASVSRRGGSSTAKAPSRRSATTKKQPSTMTEHKAGPSSLPQLNLVDLGFRDFSSASDGSASSAQYSVNGAGAPDPAEFPFPALMSPPLPSPSIHGRPRSAIEGPPANYFFHNSLPPAPPPLVSRHSYSSLPTYELQPESPVDELSNQLDYTGLVNVGSPSSIATTADMRQVTPRASPAHPSWLHPAQHQFHHLPPVPSSTSSVAVQVPMYDPSAFVNHIPAYRQQEDVHSQMVHQAPANVFSFSPPGSSVAPQSWSSSPHLRPVDSSPHASHVAGLPAQAHYGYTHHVQPHEPFYQQSFAPQASQAFSGSSSPHVPHSRLSQDEHFYNHVRQQQRHQKQETGTYGSQTQNPLDPGSYRSSPPLGPSYPLLPDGTVPSVLQAAPASSAPGFPPLSDSDITPPGNAPAQSGTYSYYHGP